ncbi:unnamed protein product [Darwinula stevensoni]|uniref:Diacylglycerol kinase n=1 Tax=Darwinula stevensoni TaxID=69355 RepID=A0A7R9A1X9_9CRUS|nr:unnamed protein product [Darwinula stevensoni]CAG0887545.1 unnamed protein product [Darwinula stevensoni]
MFGQAVCDELASSGSGSSGAGSTEDKAFALKPIPGSSVSPLLVFINPKSGGNQGLKLLQKFQWLLNPRQVFDLTQGGPEFGLKLYQKVERLQLLACGGDGTVGWILSTLDQLEFSPQPALAVIPLGTGNDLARALGWGGGYEDEPVSKLLLHVNAGEPVSLDRWCLDVEPNTSPSLPSKLSAESTEGEDVPGEPAPPLKVFNNYFSLGVDAQIALEFHEAREANPEKFSSRLRNKMFYGQVGGKDLLQRKWKNLSDMISVELDGKDMTARLKEIKCHALVFLNISSYAGGTRPWNSASGKQTLDDGYLEVLGLTTYQLPLLQAGGHGTCIAQCKRARIVTHKTIPMQVDGEACRVSPVVITIQRRNQAKLIAKRRSSQEQLYVPSEMIRAKQMKIGVKCLLMQDYELHQLDPDKLRSIGLSTLLSLSEILAVILGTEEHMSQFS